MEELAQLFTLLAEPVRLKILGLLASGEKCVCKLYPALSLPQSTVSRHLGLLRLGNIVAARREGTWMHYRLSPETWPLSWREPLTAAIEAAAKQTTQHDSLLVTDASPTVKIAEMVE